jgi:hypothetical protein
MADQTRVDIMLALAALVPREQPYQYSYDPKPVIRTEAEVMADVLAYLTRGHVAPPDQLEAMSEELSKARDQLWKAQSDLAALTETEDLAHAVIALRAENQELRSQGYLMTDLVDWAEGLPAGVLAALKAG